MFPELRCTGTKKKAIFATQLSSNNTLDFSLKTIQLIQSFSAKLVCHKYALRPSIFFSQIFTECFNDYAIVACIAIAKKIDLLTLLTKRLY